MSATPKKKSNGSYRLRILASLKDQMASFDKPRYTLEEVMRLANMTRAQVVNLSKVGLVIPRWRTYSKTGPGRRPLFYSPEDVLRVLIISDMRHAKFSLQQVRKVIRNLEELGQEIDAHSYLLTDGHSVQVLNSSDEVIDIFRHKRQLLLLVSIEDQIRKLKKTA
jgi:DNA-binding transcriptional MerR regulator